MKSSEYSSYAPALKRAITAGVTRICAELDEWMPLTTDQVKKWLVYLAGSKRPEDYYLRRGDLPMFLFPWFLEKSQGNTDTVFMRERVFSTLNGFYYIRLLDDITDHHALSEVSLLPALGFFHTQFQSPYQKYFAADHAFWHFFRRVWFHSADVTMRDLRFRQINRRQFMQIAAQKTCAVKIPVAGVAFQYGQADVLGRWSQFIDVYGCWHQMSNDMFHWHEDLSLGTATYFLSEAAGRKRKSETIPDWVMREGFEWGLHDLDQWMGQAQELAGELECADLVHYLQYRSESVQSEANAMRETLQTAAKLGDLLFS
jgi:hypothetical protein